MKIYSRTRAALGACAARRILCSSLICTPLLWPGPSHAQDNSAKPLARSNVVPTLESLPHVTLPHSRFKTWCGQKDRFLLSVGGQLEAYDADVKSSKVAVSASWPLQCAADGQQLVYVDYRMGNITKVDIATGVSRPLASYKPSGYEAGNPAISPDLRSIATAVPLRLATDAADLKVIPVRNANEASPREEVRDIKWNGNSSKLFVAYLTAIEVLDASGGRIGWGVLPKGSYYRDGWFDAAQQALILLLALENSTIDPAKYDVAPYLDQTLRAKQAMSGPNHSADTLVFQEPLEPDRACAAVRSLEWLAFDRRGSTLRRSFWRHSFLRHGRSHAHEGLPEWRTSRLCVLRGYWRLQA